MVNPGGQREDEAKVLSRSRGHSRGRRRPLLKEKMWSELPEGSPELAVHSECVQK